MNTLYSICNYVTSCFQILLKLLVTAVGDISNSSNEELLLNVIAACTNITYYTSQFVNKIQVTAATDIDSNNNKKVTAASTRRMIELSTHLAQCLFHDNTEIVLETARVLGKCTAPKCNYLLKAVVCATVFA